MNQTPEPVEQLPWRKFISSPLFFIPATLLAYLAAGSFLAALIVDVFKVAPVDLGGVGFQYLLLFGGGSFVAITGVNVANKLKPKDDPQT